MTIGRNSSKKATCLKGGGGRGDVTGLLKPQNLGKVVVLARSALFANKSSSVRALDQWRAATGTRTDEFACAERVNKIS